VKESIRNLRDAYAAYQAALQARYDELAKDVFGASSPGDLSFDQHEVIAYRMSLEERAVEHAKDDDGMFFISVEAYIEDDFLYLIKADGGYKRTFDLS
jgi:hypothetical protein